MRVVNQLHLQNVVSTLFGVKSTSIPSNNNTDNSNRNSDVIFHYNARKKTQLKHPQSGYYLELDIHVPHLDLSFEFQDAYHYVDTWASHHPLQRVVNSDRVKSEGLAMRGRTLIQVPCWWSGDGDSLISSILFQRPDIIEALPSHSFIDSCIPLNPPSDFFPNYDIPGVGPLMLASFPSSQNFLDLVSEDNYWWIGEKYDGVRCCWDPLSKQLYSRSCHELQILPQAYDTLPNTFLDCEIWFGRGNFLESQQVAYSYENVCWSFLRLIAFDCPPPSEHFGKSFPFESRYRTLLHQTCPSHPLIISAPRIAGITKESLHILSHEVLNNLGEGIILRSPLSEYISGRSNLLLKYKASREDTEALVVNINFSNESPVTTSLTLQLSNGLQFTTTLSTEIETKLNPKIGDIISFSYDSISTSNFVPIRPQVYRVRNDVFWANNNINDNKNNNPEYDNNNNTNYKSATIPAPAVTRNALQLKDPIQDNSDDSENDIERQVELISSSNKLSRMRHFFENTVAKQVLMFDPFVANNWYSVSPSEIKSIKGASTILSYFGGSVAKAVIRLFPELELDLAKFNSTPQGFWKDLNNRRQLLSTIAQSKDMDPLVASTWYTLGLNYVQSYKGVSSMLAYYRGNLISGLKHIFPEIDFVDFCFPTLPPSYWHNKLNRRKFLEYYMTANKKDPLNPQHWYSTTVAEILATKHGESVLHHYQEGKARALLDLFPEVNFDMSKFKTLPDHYWSDKKNHKIFFESLAHSLGHDPLSAKNWYKVTSQFVSKRKGGRSVLRYYNGSLLAALVNSFPNIKFDPLKFDFIPRQFWHTLENRKSFFDSFSTLKAFDPRVPYNWYHVHVSSIAKTKHGKAVLSYYDGSLSKALMDIYPDIGLQKSEFKATPLLPDETWKDPNNRKQFFIEFAKQNNFDYDIPGNWYNVSQSAILTRKNGRKVLSWYEGDFTEALAHLFPSVDFEPKKFTKAST